MRKVPGREVWASLRQMVGRLWLHKTVRWSVGALLIILIATVGLQLVYPSDRTLPRARINGEAVGYQTYHELTPLLETGFTDTKVTLQAASLSSTARLGDFGAKLKTEETTRQLMDYPLWQRLLPFSLVLKSPEIRKLALELNDGRLREAADKLVSQLKSEPKNGAVVVSDSGEIEVTAAQDGVLTSSDDIVLAIKQTPLRLGDNILVLHPKITPPSVTNNMIDGVKDKLGKLLKIELAIQNSLDKAKTYRPDKKVLASWIAIGDNLELSIDQTALAGYASDVAKEQLIAAGMTTISMRDGVEQGRTSGQPGRGVDVDALADGVAKALFSSGPTQLTMNFKTVAPTIVYSYSYSSSPAALQAYVNDVSRNQNIEIAVKQLSGAGWSASSNGSKSVVAASTYKLFISLLLFDKVKAGQINWGDSIQGTDVATCLRNTIVVSANNCAEQWIAEWGRSNINTALYAKGFSKSTSFTMPDATHTSANDLQKLLIGLHERSLFASDDAERLLGHMKQQVYRQGIPAGSKGLVADKVGFLWDYLNDAAIVYHPRGTYVLVIMTQGQSWGKIAEITRQIENIMYP